MCVWIGWYSKSQNSWINSLQMQNIPNSIREGWFPGMHGDLILSRNVDCVALFSHDFFSCLFSFLNSARITQNTHIRYWNSFSVRRTDYWEVSWKKSNFFEQQPNKRIQNKHTLYKVAITIMKQRIHKQSTKFRVFFCLFYWRCWC